MRDVDPIVRPVDLNRKSHLIDHSLLTCSVADASRGGRAASATGGAGVGRRHRRVDRHLPRDSIARAAARARDDHRQRRRRAGREQPAASRRQSRRPSRARARRAVSHLQALARVLSGLRRPGGAPRLPSLVVLGGDKHLGRPRCVEHAWQLRQQIRARHPELELGGWANPNGDPVRAGRVPARCASQRRFLSHADRVASSGAAASRRFSTKRDAAA